MNEKELKELGVDDDVLKKVAEIIDKERNEAVAETKASIAKLSKQLEEERKKAEEVVAEANKKIITKELEVALSKETVADIGAAMALIDKEQIAVEEDGTVNITKAIDSAKAKYPGVFSKPTNPTTFTVKSDPPAQSTGTTKQDGLTESAKRAIKLARKVREADQAANDKIKKTWH